ncbi:MAG TPA: cell division protein ZapB [Thermoanaerobaculia bacterium]|nr:cell division protein ZapB [Thermoanaerobaculia bacterium]
MKKNRETEQMVLAGTEEGEILARLSERVERAIATIQELRRERDALKEKLARAEEQLRALDAAGEEQERLRRERSEIRNRIESILANLEGLEESGDS